jgi:hypothetical protein
MFGNLTAREGLRVTGRYRNRSMQHTCSRHAAWDRHILGGEKARACVVLRRGFGALVLCITPISPLPHTSIGHQFQREMRDSLRQVMRRTRAEECLKRVGLWWIFLTQFAFCRSQLPHKSVNLSFTTTCINSKLTDFCWN